MGSVARTCRLCEQPFVITDEELAQLRAVQVLRRWPELRLPVYCTPCRAFRRVERFQAKDDGRDVERRCIQCGGVFVWTAGEKRFYAERGYARPRRCHACRPGARAMFRRDGQ